jgi:hypothetical protein
MESGGRERVESVWWVNDESKGEWERDGMGVRWMWIVEEWGHGLWENGGT